MLKDWIAETPLIVGQHFITSKQQQSGCLIKALQVAKWAGFQKIILGGRVKWPLLGIAILPDAPQNYSAGLRVKIEIQSQVAK